MAWRGKVIGGTVGFLIGAPLLGAVGASIGTAIGVTIGGVYDEKNDAENRAVFCPKCGEKISIEGEGHWICPHCNADFVYTDDKKTSQLSDLEEREANFFISLFSMVGKIAKADGHISKNEIKVVDDFMENTLELQKDERDFAIKIFNEAKNSEHEFAKFANNFILLNKNDPDMVFLMMCLLFEVAAADKKLHIEEEKLLLEAKDVFNITDSEYDVIQERFFSFSISNKYYSVLKCTKNSTNDEIKASYRKLVANFHPDKIMSKGLPDEFVKFAEKQFIEIQEAYEHIKNERGF